MMKKTESILKLEELELNTLDYFITKDKREITHYLAKHLDDSLSLRTERGTEYLCPFYYQVKGGFLLEKAILHITDGYTVIVAPSLDTKGCQYFGNIGLSDKLSDVIEFVVGEGKVRELDAHPEKRVLLIPPGKLTLEWQRHNPDLELDTRLNIGNIYKLIKEKCYDQMPCVVEWSYYKQRVGRLKEHEIYWEIRPY